MTASPHAPGSFWGYETLQERDAVLTALWYEGHVVPEIARRFKVSPAAVTSRVRKMRLARRPCPVTESTRTLEWWKQQRDFIQECVNAGRTWREIASLLSQRENVAINLNVMQKAGGRLGIKMPKPQRVAKPAPPRIRLVHVAPEPMARPVEITSRLYADTADQPGLCQFPLNDRYPWRFCAAEAVEKNLCAHHHGIVWVTQPGRRRIDTGGPERTDYRATQARIFG